MTRVIALVLAAGCAAAHAADPTTWADWPAAPRMVERASFEALDTNRDFSLSRDEAAASPAVAVNFANFDLDGDRRLAPIEFNNLALTLALG